MQNTLVLPSFLAVFWKQILTCVKYQRHELIGLLDVVGVILFFKLFSHKVNKLIQPISFYQKLMFNKCILYNRFVLYFYNVVFDKIRSQQFLLGCLFQHFFDFISFVEFQMLRNYL